MQKIKIDSNDSTVEIHLAPLNWVQLHMYRGVIKHVSGSNTTIFIVSFQDDMEKIRDNLLALARELNASLEALPEAFRMVTISLRASDIIPAGVGYEKYEQFPAMQGGIIGSGHTYALLNCDGETRRAGSDAREITKVTVGMDSLGCSEFTDQIQRSINDSVGKPNIDRAKVEGQESMCESILKKGV